MIGCSKVRLVQRIKVNTTHEIQTDRKPSVQFGYFKNRRG